MNVISNWDLKQDDEVDFKEIAAKIKYIIIKLTVKDFVIIMLILMMFIIYIIHNREIEACNIFFNDILKNTTKLTTSLW